MKVMKNLLTYLLYIFVLTAIGATTLWYQYSQRYVQDGPKTATTGIFFQKTLNLKEYRRVSNGNGFLGKYDRWSRSDRHNDVITVYCNQYCSK